MAGRGRGRGISPVKAEAKPVLSVSRGRGTHTLSISTKPTQQGNVGKSSVELCKDSVIGLLDKRQNDNIQDIVDELIQMVGRYRDGTRSGCDILISAIFSDEFMLKFLPTYYIIDILTDLESRKVGNDAVRDVLFTRLQKVFTDREVLLAKNNDHIIYEMNMLILSGLTKTLKSPQGVAYIPLVKATLTWLTEMLNSDTDSFITSAAAELVSISAMLRHLEKLIDSSQIDSLYLACRRAIIQSKQTSTRKSLLKCLEMHLRKSDSLDQAVSAVYV